MSVISSSLNEVIKLISMTMKQLEHQGLIIVYNLNYNINGINYMDIKYKVKIVEQTRKDFRRDSNPKLDVFDLEVYKSSSNNNHQII